MPQDRPELRLANDVAEALDRAEALLREQHVVEEGMKRLAEAGGGADSEAGQRLFDIKEAMVEEVSRLEQEIVRLRAETRTSHRVASDLLAGARMTIEDDKLLERVRYSRGLIGVQDTGYTREFEAETTRLVEELHEELERAGDAIRGDQLVGTSRF